jgi:hypothetical protein
LNPGATTLRAIALAAVSLALASPARALTTFHPSVHLDVAYNDNVQFGGAGTEPVSDWASRLGVTLPLTRDWGRGTWSLVYSPAYDKHDTLAELDHMEHRLATQLSRTGRSTTLSGAASFTRTQEQGRARSLESPDLFLSQRTNRDFLAVEMNFSHGISARWRWGAGVWGGRYNYSQIENFDPGTPLAAVEDRDELRGSVNVSRQLTRGASLGASYEHRRYDLETGEIEDVDLVGVTYGQTTSREVTMELRVGGYQRRTDPAAGAVVIDDESESGMQGTFSLKRAFRTTSLELGAEVLPSAGGALEGTSTDASAGITFGSTAGRRWSWSVSSRYAYRDPTDPTEDTLSSVSGSAGAEWRPHTNLGLRIGAAFVDQSGNTATTLDTSFFSGAAGIVWYPRGYGREEAMEGT